MELNNSLVDVSVIVVNWNSGNFLKETIESLYEHTANINFEVIVLDNQSKEDDSSYIFLKEEASKFENLKVVFNEDNLGFTKANNVGMDMSCGKHVLLLNPDVTLKSNLLKILFDYLEANPKAGIIGPKVLNPDGSFQHYCRRGNPTPLNVITYLSGISALFKNNAFLNKFSLFHLPEDEIAKVTAVSGCCMMVKDALIKEIGKMDERFFMYQEETDWCWRAYNSGWETIYNPEALIVHEARATIRKSLLRTNRIATESMEKFFRKHFFDKYNFAQKGLILFLIWANFVLRYLKIRFALFFNEIKK